MGEDWEEQSSEMTPGAEVPADQALGPWCRGQVRKAGLAPDPMDIMGLAGGCNIRSKSQHFRNVLWGTPVLQHALPKEKLQVVRLTKFENR